MSIAIFTESVFERLVTPDEPLVARDCDLVTHIHNPGTTPVKVRVVVGFEDMVEYTLAAGEKRPFIDDGPFPMVAVQYTGVRVVADSDLLLTCALCDLTTRRALVKCRIGEWSYADGTVAKTC